MSEYLNELETKIDEVNNLYDSSSIGKLTNDKYTKQVTDLHVTVNDYEKTRQKKVDAAVLLGPSSFLPLGFTLFHYFIGEPNYHSLTEVLYRVYFNSGVDSVLAWAVQSVLSSGAVLYVSGYFMHKDAKKKIIETMKSLNIQGDVESFVGKVKDLYSKLPEFLKKC